MSERIAEMIKNNYEELIFRILEVTPPGEGASSEDIRQFITGFVHMLEQAARGNLEPRTQYLSAVVPAIKAGGMPGTVVFGGMVGVAMAVAAYFASDPDALGWTVEFCCNYTRDLAAAYS